MSSFTHINQDPVFNEVVRSIVPPRWSHLVSHSLESSHDASLSGIKRTIYTAPSPGADVHGEVWTVSPEAPQATCKVTTGRLQMYAVSGADSLTKNGQVMFLRAGEKVSFAEGDTFSFNGKEEMCIFVRSEGGSISLGTPVKNLATFRMPTNEDVERTRAMLGLYPESAQTQSYNGPRREETSSRGYARAKSSY